MIKNLLNYCLNLRNKVLESKLTIFLLGVGIGSYIDFVAILESIPTFFWVLSFFGLAGLCYFLYLKYKFNQDTFGDF